MTIKIKVGDYVLTDHDGYVEPVKVTRIEFDASGGEKYGEQVSEIEVSQKDRCIFDLDYYRNEKVKHWKYGDQVLPFDKFSKLVKSIM